MTQSKLMKQEDWEAVDSPALSDEMLARMQPVQKAHPGTPPRVRGPQKTPVKTPVSIRLNPEVVDYFKAQGKGWQTRINEALTEYIINHQDS